MIYRKVEKRIRGRDLRHDAFERRVGFDRGRPLHESDVATANHSHIPVRPALFGDPIDRVVTIFALVHEGLPLAVAVVASAHVLCDVHVTTLGPPLASQLRQNFAAIWRALEDDRMFGITSGTHNIGDELDSVAHFYLDGLLSPRGHYRLTQFRMKRRRINQEAFMTCGHGLQPLRRDIPRSELTGFREVHIELDRREAREVNIRDLFFATCRNGTRLLFRNRNFDRAGAVKHENVDVLNAVLRGIENFGPGLTEDRMEVSEQDARRFVVDGAAVCTNSNLRLAVFG